MHRMLLVNKMSWCVEGAIEGVWKIDRVCVSKRSTIVRGRQVSRRGRVSRLALVDRYVVQWVEI